MKYVKLFFKNVLGIICVCAFIFIIDMIFLCISYTLNSDNFEKGYNLVKLDEYYNPDGAVYSHKYNVILQAAYNSQKGYSSILVLDGTSGRINKELRMRNNDNTAYTKRALGIATDEERVWITSDYEVSEFSLDTIINTREEYVNSYSRDETINKADFCVYSNGTLWIGEYYLKFVEDVKHDDALLMGFDANSKNYTLPNVVVTLPSMVRSIAIANGEFAVVRSFNSFINSNLSFYSIPLGHESEYYNIEGNQIPLYHFDKDSLKKKISLPPRSKGIYYDNKSYLNIANDNASKEYFYAFPKIKNYLRYYIEVDE